jgi:uncharacterized protein YdaU (DUF1376 family)
MNYYKRHIGDYAAKAGHLSPLEHGVYTLLIDAYYNREEAPTKAEAIRWARARSADELAAVEAILAEFFTEVDGRFLQTRIEEELAAFHVKQEANRQLGARGGLAKAKRNASESLSENLAKQDSDRLAKTYPSHKPLATSHEEAKASLPPDGCPHAEIIEMYHQALPANPRIKAWTGKRQSNLRTRWREDEKRQSLDYWKRFFAHVAGSPFLTGQRADRQGRPFLPGLDWLVMPENFAKVIEGRYHDKGGDA